MSWAFATSASKWRDGGLWRETTLILEYVLVHSQGVVAAYRDEGLLMDVMIGSCAGEGRA